MITNLHIKNIGIIDDLEIDLNEGLNVLTGETGAGKTLIIGALAILSGGRFSKDMIRKGESSSYIEACFYEPNNTDSIDGNIIVSREINNNGKNLCKINGRMVTVCELKNFMSAIMEIHGQNDNQNLLNNENHIKYLDGFIGEKVNSLKIQYLDYYNKYVDVKKKLKENYGDDKERQRKLDLLKYQFNEIKDANLKDGEEDELEAKRKVIINSEKIEESLKGSDLAIGENCEENLSLAIKYMEKISDVDKKYENIAKSLKNIYYDIQEIARDISEYKEEIEFNETDRNEIEQRLDLIYSLKRKYGNSIKEILEYMEKLEQEISYIENLDIYNNELKKEQKILEQKLNELGSKINKIRVENAIILSKKINKELEELEMKNAKINVKVDYKINEYFSTGKDIISFYITTNIGEGEKELSKIASGGEMSRTMLAIKKVLAESDKISIMVFDEIDTGISGKAANSVAVKLKKISQSHQVICISHLASIAAIADYNYFISKNVTNERTNTNIKLLNEDETVKEIARISSGEVNDVSLKFAYELRNKKAS